MSEISSQADQSDHYVGVKFVFQHDPTISSDVLSPLSEFCLAEGWTYCELGNEAQLIMIDSVGLLPGHPEKLVNLILQLNTLPIIELYAWVDDGQSVVLENTLFGALDIPTLRQLILTPSPEALDGVADLLSRIAGLETLYISCNDGNAAYREWHQIILEGDLIEGFCLSLGGQRSLKNLTISSEIPLSKTALCHFATALAQLSNLEYLQLSVFATGVNTPISHWRPFYHSLAKLNALHSLSVSLPVEGAAFSQALPKSLEALDVNFISGRSDRDYEHPSTWDPPVEYDEAAGQYALLLGGLDCPRLRTLRFPYTLLRLSIIPELVRYLSCSVVETLNARFWRTEDVDLFLESLQDTSCTITRMDCPSFVTTQREPILDATQAHSAVISSICERNKKVKDRLLGAALRALTPARALLVDSSTCCIPLEIRRTIVQHASGDSTALSAKQWIFLEQYATGGHPETWVIDGRDALFCELHLAR